ncbi:MAG: hypothetical protein J6F30_16020 [Cellulosilyticum sp.]|nr:hypothetical protein [Cellulosilyticum sp.]
MKDYEKLIEDKYERFTISKTKYAVLKISTPLPKAEIIYHSWFSNDWDNTGYIFYKPFFRTKGKLYMFKGEPFELPEYPPLTGSQKNKQLKGLQLKKRFKNLQLKKRFLIGIYDFLFHLTQKPDYTMRNKAEKRIATSVFIDLLILSLIGGILFLIVWYFFYK